MNVRQVVESYIVDNILFGDGQRLKDDVSFHESGILDSLGFLELVTFAEKRFNIQIADQEVIPAVTVDVARIPDVSAQAVGTQAGRAQHGVCL